MSILPGVFGVGLGAEGGFLGVVLLLRPPHGRNGQTREVERGLVRGGATAAILPFPMAISWF